MLYGASLRDDDGCFCSLGMRFVGCSTGFVRSMCIADCGCRLRNLISGLRLCQEVHALCGLKMNCLPWVMQNGNKKSCEGLRSYQELCVSCCYNIVPYLLTPWCRALLEKLTGFQLVKKFPAFHGTRRFITAFTSVRHLSLSWASPIQSIYPHPTSWISILILSTHLRLGLPSGLSLRLPHQDPVHPPLLAHTL